MKNESQNRTKNFEVVTDDIYEMMQENKSETALETNSYFLNIQNLEIDTVPCECMASPHQIDQREKELNELRTKMKNKIINLNK